MCIIVLDRNGGSVTEQQVRNMFTRNGDGFGIIPLVDNKPTAIKVGKPNDVDDVLNIWERHKDAPYVMHLRLRTHGKIDELNCHPYPLFDEHTWLFHNGVMRNALDYDKEKSDTWHFAEHFVRPIGPSIFEHLEDLEFKKSLGKMIGDTNKLVFVSPKRIHIVNESAGTWRNENAVWLSNLLAVDTPHTARVTYGYAGGVSDDWSGNWGGYNRIAQNRNTSTHSNLVKVISSTSIAFTRQDLVRLSINEMAACIRYAWPEFEESIKTHFKIDISKPKSTQDIRTLSFDLYKQISITQQET